MSQTLAQLIAGTTTQNINASTLVLNGSGSGTTTLSAPTAAGNNTLVLPNSNGTARQTMMTDGAGALSFVNDAGALYYRLNADLAGANVTTAQSVFGVGVTLAASTVYQFDGLYILYKSSITATTHYLNLGFGGTATINNIIHSGSGTRAPNGIPDNSIAPDAFASNTATLSRVSNTVSATASGSLFYFRICGTVSINAGGTFIPQYSLSAAPGAYSTITGSYIRFVPIGAAGSASSQGTWS